MVRHAARRAEGRAALGDGAHQPLRGRRVRHRRYVEGPAPLADALNRSLPRSLAGEVHLVELATDVPSGRAAAHSPSRRHELRLAGLCFFLVSQPAGERRLGSRLANRAALCLLLLWTRRHQPIAYGALHAAEAALGAEAVPTPTNGHRRVLWHLVVEADLAGEERPGHKLLARSLERDVRRAVLVCGEVGCSGAGHRDKPKGEQPRQNSWWLALSWRPVR